MSGGQIFISWNVSHFRGYLLELLELFIIIYYSSVLTPSLTLMFLVFEQEASQSSFDSPSLILQQHEGVPSEQSITSLKKAGGGGVQMWEVGFWLHWQLWGTEVFQSRKWLDLPCGTLAHPDNSPHCFEHPGSPQAPTEGSGATSERQGRENLLVQAARTGFGWCCATSTEQNRAKDSTKTLKGIVSLKIKMRAAPLLFHLFNTTRQHLFMSLYGYVLYHTVTELPNRKLIKQVVC